MGAATPAPIFFPDGGLPGPINSPNFIKAILPAASPRPPGLASPQLQTTASPITGLSRTNRSTSRDPIPGLAPRFLLRSGEDGELVDE